MTEQQKRFASNHLEDYAFHIMQVDTNDDDRIQQPGKFEGEPYYLPFLWYEVYEDFSGDCGEKGYNISDDDEILGLIPELSQYRSIELYESDNGFVGIGNCSYRK